MAGRTSFGICCPHSAQCRVSYSECPADTVSSTGRGLLGQWENGRSELPALSWGPSADIVLRSPLPTVSGSWWHQGRGRQALGKQAAMSRVGSGEAGRPSRPPVLHVGGQFLVSGSQRHLIQVGVGVLAWRPFLGRVPGCVWLLPPQGAAEGRRFCLRSVQRRGVPPGGREAVQLLQLLPPRQRGGHESPQVRPGLRFALLAEGGFWKRKRKRACGRLHGPSGLCERMRMSPSPCGTHSFICSQGSRSADG